MYFEFFSVLKLSFSAQIFATLFLWIDWALLDLTQMMFSIVIEIQFWKNPLFHALCFNICSMSFSFPVKCCSMLVFCTNNKYQHDPGFASLSLRHIVCCRKINHEKAGKPQFGDRKIRIWQIIPFYNEDQNLQISFAGLKRAPSFYYEQAQKLKRNSAIHQGVPWLTERIHTLHGSRSYVSDIAPMS